MAKRSSRRGTSRLNATAESLGSALGHVAARVEALNRQRAEVAADIRRIIAAGERLLTELGQSAQTAVARRKGGRPKGYRMSEETKAKLRAAWRRRKAALGRGRQAE
jgi:hypothetical protein